MPESIDNVPIKPVQPNRPEGPADAGKPSGAPGPADAKFADVLKEALGEVNEMQIDAEKAVEDLLTGKRDDVSRVLLAVQKADLAFETMMQIRNKLLEAYQEIMRMRT